MATEQGPDISVGRAAVERLMDDGCVITRPLADPDDPPVIYSAATHPEYDAEDASGGARFLFRTISSNSAQGAVEEDEYRYAYRASVPLGLTELEEGDLLVLTSSRRDPGGPLVGQQFIVRDLSGGTLSVSRRFRLERHDPTRRYEEIAP